MIKNDLITYINNIVALPEDIANRISEAFTQLDLPKRTILEKQDAICGKLYFVKKGLARLYYRKEDRDITGWFACDGSFITCNDSFFQRKTSHLNLELLEDSTLFAIDYDKLNELFEIKEMERFGRHLFYNVLSELSDRMYATLFQSAEKRYQLLIAYHPEVAFRAPLGDIATYLGISQETLSRIRSQQIVKSKDNTGIYNKVK